MAGMNQDYLDAIKGKGKLVGGDCPAAPAPQAEGTCPRCQSDSRLIRNDTVSSSKLRTPCRHDWHDEEGAAPAETARPNRIEVCAEQAGHYVTTTGPMIKTGETAGEMTAEQFHRNKYGHTLVHPIEAYEFAEAFAKQRVEQVERDAKRERDIIREAANGLARLFESSEAKVADLERERDTARETSKELNRRNGALQHTLNTLTDRNVWYGYYKAAISLFGWEEDKRKAAESDLREMREALEELPLDMLDKEIENIDAAEFVDNAEAFIQAMLKAKAVLARKAGS